MNTLKSDFIDTFTEAFSSIENDPDIKAVVFTSGKKDSFIAGADITMLEAVTSAEEGERVSREGHKVMNRIEDCPKPVVAAIHGVALGGGLEVALACHARVATDSKKTQLGLPEAQLGLLPGGGGTQRLPRQIGVQAALDLMLTGKNRSTRRRRSSSAWSTRWCPHRSFSKPPRPSRSHGLATFPIVRASSSSSATRTP